MNRKLYRNEYHKVLGGVCYGLAEYFDMDPSIVRIIFVIGFFAGGVTLIPYIVLWIVLPKKGYLYSNFQEPIVDYKVPPDQPFTQNPPPYQQYNSFSNNPFANRQYNSEPFQNVKPKQPSHAGIIFGVVLIVIGGFILIDNYDLIPDFDFERLWPVILVVVGISLILSGQTRQLWDKPAQPEADNNSNSVNDNPPAGSEPETKVI